MKHAATFLMVMVSAFAQKINAILLDFLIILFKTMRMAFLSALVALV